MHNKSDYINELWANTVIATLIHSGVRQYYLSPGYRNAPLIAALINYPDATIHNCFDERAAGYQALGFAKASEAGAALISTSGTAAANYYPAVIEAYKARLPLIIISADRPFELVHTGANQVIEQNNIFGRFSKKCLDLPEPSYQLPLQALSSHIRMLVAKSRRSPYGPVHINMPFREPLEPSSSLDIPSKEAFKPLEDLKTRLLLQNSPPFIESRAHCPEQLERLITAISSCSRGLLIIGPTEPSVHGAITKLAHKLQWPTYIDILASPLRHHTELKERSIIDLNHPESYNNLQSYDPDLILHFGKRLVSKWFDIFIQKDFKGHLYTVTSDQDLLDSTHTCIEHFQVHENVVLESLENIQISERNEASKKLLIENSHLKEKLRNELSSDHSFSFPQLANGLLQLIPPHHNIFLGNSLTVRIFDFWEAIIGRRAVYFTANRGVSGIEGQLATAIGLAEGKGTGITLVLGDISMLHDLNSLIVAKDSKHPIIIIIINNLGGGIFKKLPINHHPAILTPHLTTPHNLRFKGICEMAGVQYSESHCKESFAKAYHSITHSQKTGLIECLISEESS